MHDESRGASAALVAAQQTIARQAEEIEQLRRRLADEQFAEQLRKALTLASTAGVIATPVNHTRLLEMIVETAAQVITSRSAALFLLDEESQELVFEVALGPKAAEAKKFRVPLGHGIAGLVAVTGQPMASSDASQDPRQAADMARSIGYIPQSILCVPLFYNGQIIGVLELLDKEGAKSFTHADMHALGLFANTASVAIEQSRTHTNLAGLIGAVLKSLGETAGEGQAALQHGAKGFGIHVEQDAAYHQALDLARLVQQIAWTGEHEYRACRTILQGFADYLRTRPHASAELEGWR